MLRKLQGITEAMLPFLPVFLANLFLPRDPDLGWHLKYGEYFMQHGHVLRENTFSTEMAGYVWNNINWGTDVVTYLFYSLGGLFGLSVAAAGVITLTFLLFAKAFSLSFWEKAVSFPVLLYLMTPLHVNSFRGQLLSLLMLGVLTYLMKRYERFPGRTLYLTPIVFLFWANLHGLFLLGFGVFGLWQIFTLVQVWIEERNRAGLIPHLKRFIPVSLLSFLATLIHPYGIGIYQETFSYIGNPLLPYITEYTGAQELSTEWYNFLIAVVISGIAITGYVLTKSFTTQIVPTGLFSVLLLLSLWVRRYSWAMYYFLMPFLQTVASYFTPESRKGRFWGGIVLSLLTLVIIFILKQPFPSVTGMNWDAYCESLSTCSANSAQELRRYYKAGKTFTTYGIGGYMIWHTPDMKPSVDGRMHLWKDDTGYSAFLYTYQYEWDKKSIQDSKYSVAYVEKSKAVYERLIKLSKENKWRQVYADPAVAIFIRT